MKKQILILFLAIGIVSFSSQAQEQIDKLQVVGKSSIKAVPEDFEVQIPILVKDSLYEECSKSLISKINNLKSEMNAVGINEELIKSTGFSIDDNYYYDRSISKRIKDGYRGSVQLQIVQFYTPEKLGKIIGVLMQNEITYSLGFKLSEKQKERLIEQAIEQAVLDGKNKAELVAKYSGIDLVKIHKITYDYTNYGIDRLIVTDYEEEEEVVYGILENFALNPKQLSIEKEIFIEWLIKN